MHSLTTRIILGLWVALVLIFLFGPIAIIAVYAFNASNIQTWPIPGFSLQWFASAWNNREIRAALVLSLEAGVIATAIAVVLGTAAAFAVHRFRFFGREIVSFGVVLPIALPGIITGMALNSFFTLWGVGLSFWTIVIGHATFCAAAAHAALFLRGLDGSRRR
jgi:putative spermidine/putrescine transport system permease protein